MSKIFVEVMARHTKQGEIMPTSLKWEDGRTFSIDKITDIRVAASLKAGGQGIRYTCRILGKQVYLYCDEGKWFVEVNV